MYQGKERNRKISNNKFLKVHLLYTFYLGSNQHRIISQQQIQYVMFNQIKPESPALQADSLLSELQRSPIYFSQYSSVTQLCPTLCNPMNCSTPGLPVHHQLPEFTQTHVHQVSDAIQPSHPLSSPSPPAPHPSQHQSLFQ